MSNLLKEAIADAKAVRATALANAKAALEEAFKPQLEAMFAEKLKSEIASDDGAVKDETSHQMNDEIVDDGNMEETITNEELDEILAELEKEITEEPMATDAQAGAPAPAPEAPAADAPVADAPVAPAADVSVPSPDAPAPTAAAPVAPAPAPEAPVEEPAPAPETPVAEEESLEEIDLNELLSSLEEEAKEDDEDGKEEKVDEAKEEKEEKDEDEESVKEQLSEALGVITYLRDQLNEINLLNAKLLYTNKLFNQYDLNRQQKIKIIETFDLAKSIREVKLSYAILSESYSSGASVVKKTSTTVKSITEGLASKPVASTKPSKDVIVENVNGMASRFQKLAGIKK